MEKIDELKMILRENEYPCFSDDELVYFIEKNNGNVEDAAYQALLAKAETSHLSIAGLSLSDTSEYWLRLAQSYRASKTRIV